VRKTHLRVPNPEKKNQTKKYVDRENKPQNTKPRKRNTKPKIMLKEKINPTQNPKP